MKKLVIAICILLSMSILFCFSVSAASDFYFTETYWKSCFENSKYQAKPYLYYISDDSDYIELGSALIDTNFVIPNFSNTNGEVKRFLGKTFYSLSGSTFGNFQLILPLNLGQNQLTQSFVFISSRRGEQQNVPNLTDPWDDIVYTVEINGKNYSLGESYSYHLQKNIDYVVSSPFYINSGTIVDGTYYPGYNYNAVVVSFDFTMPDGWYYINYMHLHFTSKKAVDSVASYPDAFERIWCGVFIDPETQIGVADQQIIEGLGSLGSDIGSLEESTANHLEDVKNALSDLDSSLTQPDPENQTGKEEQKQEIEETTGKLEDMGDILNNVPKPDPGTTVPSISDITSDSTIYNGDVISMLFLPIYDSKYIHWLFVTVCSFALIGYILFGKRV